MRSLAGALVRRAAEIVGERIFGGGFLPVHDTA